MLRHDRVYGVVAVVANSHRQLHGVMPDYIFSYTRRSRQHSAASTRYAYT
jgi:hypothetical protein